MGRIDNRHSSKMLKILIFTHKNLTLVSPWYITLVLNFLYIYSLAGFLTKSLDKIKQLHHQLNMESLEVAKPAGPRKKVRDI
jgi:hypothetical protein